MNDYGPLTLLTMSDDDLRKVAAKRLRTALSNCMTVLREHRHVITEDQARRIEVVSLQLHALNEELHENPEIRIVCTSKPIP